MIGNLDLFSLAIGFIIGAFTGAAGQYLGELFTDQRKSKESKLNINNEWNDLINRFPKIIAEMKEDVNKPEFKNVRKFFLKTKESTVNVNESYFQYHTDVHDDLTTAISYLEDLEYVIDITPGNCPMYRMTERFIDKLREK